jgi:hypothetical protein
MMILAMWFFEFFWGLCYAMLPHIRCCFDHMVEPPNPKRTVFFFQRELVLNMLPACLTDRRKRQAATKKGIIVQHLRISGTGTKESRSFASDSNPLR